MTVPNWPLCSTVFGPHASMSVVDPAPGQTASSLIKVIAAHAGVAIDASGTSPHTIPERFDQRARRASRPCRPLAFD
jgi:hypothetical protein